MSQASRNADLPTSHPTHLASDNQRVRMSYLPASLRSLPTTHSGHRLNHPPPRKATDSLACLASRASARALFRRYGNINPLSIDYACRPRLRSRLTQGGRTWPWNPWSLGAGDSHPSHRYSCLHSHSYALHDQVTPPLQHAHDAPLPIHTTFRSHM